MTIIMWDKPKHLISKEEWKNISADSAPGVYTSNMSNEDRSRWKGKVVGVTLGRPQVELRKSFSGSFKKLPSDNDWTEGFGANVVIIVANKGFKYKRIKRDHSIDYNIHMSMNGNIAMTYKEMEEMQMAIEEAKAKLDEVAKHFKTRS